MKVDFYKYYGVRQKKDRTKKWSSKSLVAVQLRNDSPELRRGKDTEWAGCERLEDLIGGVRPGRCWCKLLSVVTVVAITEWTIAAEGGGAEPMRARDRSVNAALGAWTLKANSSNSWNWNAYFCPGQKTHDIWEESSSFFFNHRSSPRRAPATGEGLTATPVQNQGPVSSFGIGPDFSRWKTGYTPGFLNLSWVPHSG